MTYTVMVQQKDEIIKYLMKLLGYFSYCDLLRKLLMDSNTTTKADLQSEDTVPFLGMQTPNLNPK